MENLRGAILVIVGLSSAVIVPLAAAMGRSRPISMPRINVLDHGAAGDGRTDDGPSLRALVKNISGKTVVFPPGRRFLIGTNVAPGDYPVTDRAGLIISGQKNFRIIARGATFLIGSQIPLTTTVLLDRNVRFSWEGGTFVGNRHGLSADQENVAISILNNRSFKVSSVSVSGFGGNGAAFAGDWNVDGVLSGLRLEGVGICFDMAFSKNLTIRDVIATGGGDLGRGRSSGGSKCFSNIYDEPMTSFNRTGVKYKDTDGVVVENLDASRFNTGVAISSGTNYLFRNNVIHNNLGSEAAPGIGYYIYYMREGRARSVGFPVKNLKIVGGSVHDNGSADSISDIVVDASDIRNKDAIDGISIIKVGSKIRHGLVVRRGNNINNLIENGKAVK